MILKDEFLGKLRRSFGLNLYEVRVWTALLSRGVSTAGELSEIGGVPRSRAYDVLESLEKKGFITMKLGKPIKYLAVEPSEVVERVKKLVKNDADENLNKLEALKESEALQELNRLHIQGIDFIDSTDLSGAIRGKHNLYAHLETMVKGAEKSIILMTTPKGFQRKVDALKPIFQKLAKKDVKIKIAAPFTSEECKQAAAELKDIAEIRHTEDVNGRFCIVDGKDLMFMVMHDEKVHPTYDIGIWVNTPYFAEALGTMFENSWKDMKPIE